MGEQPGHRYRVVATWGRVPEQISSIVGKHDAYLVYPEHRGMTSYQGFTENDELVGGWRMEYVGRRVETTS